MGFWDLVMCFLLAAIAGTGVGGGGLFLVYLTGPMGLAQSAAQAVNLFYFLCAAVPPTYVRRQELPWRLAAVCIAAGVPGVFLGSMIRGMLSEDLLGKIFGGLLVLSGAAVFLVREKKDPLE